MRVLRSRLAEAKSGPASMRRRTDARLGHGVVTIHYGSYWIINTLDDELKKQRQAYLCFQSDPWKEPRFVFWVKRDKKGGKLLKRTGTEPKKQTNQMKGLLIVKL
ncbi:hypothetical protein [Aneurinibacillus aneurinilyticus]|uniref:hypothetical protein n=1 Tax=Aneurinibacillus aneurinilyticus TaxID=1391 RepID=UPI0023F2D428|nr:hypothetical protein [Aneurinibacillus aneurinilyticus]MCI1696133.1 hypothetical protein [Aneurinibacillus aneurinilyticus]